MSRAREDGRLDVAEISEELDMAPETTRRDLKVLESHGLLHRVHGGAIPVDRLGFEGALATRATTLHEEKVRLGKIAVELLEDAESIYLDEGSTAQVLVDALPLDRPLTVVTNALHTAIALGARPNINLLLVGGRVRTHTLGAVDHWATRMLNDLVLDLAFVGTNGISTDHGLTTPDPAVAAVKSAAVAAARRRVLIADHTNLPNNPGDGHHPDHPPTNHEDIPQASRRGSYQHYFLIPILWHTQATKEGRLLCRIHRNLPEMGKSLVANPNRCVQPRIAARRQAATPYRRDHHKSGEAVTYPRARRSHLHDTDSRHRRYRYAGPRDGTQAG